MAGFLISFHCFTLFVSNKFFYLDESKLTQVDHLNKQMLNAFKGELYVLLGFEYEIRKTFQKDT